MTKRNGAGEARASQGREPSGRARNATNWREWRRPRQEGATVTLPSGNIAKLRPVALDMLVSSGRLPDLLSPIAARSIWSVTDQEALAKDPDLSKSMIDLINEIVPAAMLEPRCVPLGVEPGPGEIELADIDFVDKAVIFQMATEGAELLRMFRAEQTGALADPHDGQDIRAEAEHAHST